MAYLLAILVLASTAFAQLAPRPLPNNPVQRKINYQAIKVGNFGVESPVTSACGKYSDPEAQDTPNPVLRNGSSVKVDIVVGWDGKVYSPYILSTDSASADRVVLNTLRSWRFRPALCNGTPINTEANITFSRR